MRTTLALTGLVLMLVLGAIAGVVATPAGGEDPPQTVTVTRTETVKQRVLMRYQGWTAYKWASRTAYWKRRAKAMKRTLLTRPDVSEAISLACTAYHVSCATMRSLARCESGFYPRAKNRTSTASGLFQHLYPSTWRTTPFAGFSVWSAYASSFAAASMLADGRRGEWVC